MRHRRAKPRRSAFVKANLVCMVMEEKTRELACSFPYLQVRALGVRATAVFTLAQLSQTTHLHLDAIMSDANYNCCPALPGLAQKIHPYRHGHLVG